MDALRPFLACRLLGVLPLHRLRGDDTALCLAKLAQLSNPQAQLRDLFTDLTVQERAR